jgi:hypothetical protein
MRVNKTKKNYKMQKGGAARAPSNQNHSQPPPRPPKPSHLRGSQLSHSSARPSASSHQKMSERHVLYDNTETTLDTKKTIQKQLILKPKQYSNILYKNGEALKKYFTTEPYFTGRAHSDHAPVLYKINVYLNIITWNVAQYGNSYFPKGNTYNHKFIIKGGDWDGVSDGNAIEKLNDYRLRLLNLVISFRELLDNNISKTFPFLFCQELPKNDKTNLDVEKNYHFFKYLLNLYNLEVLGDGISECGFIYDNKDKPLELELETQRYSIYYSIFNGNVFYYVNIHLSYDANFNTSIKQIINNILQNNLKNGHGKIQSIYFVGDMNKSLAYQQYDLIGGDGVESIETFTTINDECFSFMDNEGKLNPHNVDYLLKVNF